MDSATVLIASSQYSSETLFEYDIDKVVLHQQSCAIRTLSKTLIVIDAEVDPDAILARGVLADAEVVILDTNQDGIDQITAALRCYPNITNLHLVSHGNPGVLYLGNTEFSLATIEHYADQLQHWFKNKQDCTLFLYGCNVAAAETEFLQRLHHLTGAVLYASATPTGNADLGGNWNLEVRFPAFPVSASPELPFDSATLALYPAILAPGDLDTTFSGDGIVTLDFNGGTDVGRSVVVQPDGKIVVAGYATNGSNIDFALTRYNPDGTLDTSFGGGSGKVTTPIGSGNDSGYSMVLQPDGKIVVAGLAFNGSNTDFALTRYNADGTLDTSFGGGSGKVTTPIGSGNDAGFSVVVQSDGKIIVAGRASNGSNDDFALTRYNSNGTLDTSFGTGGKVITPIGSGDENGQSVIIQADGKVLVAGTSFNGTDTDFALTRYNSNGTLDTSFGGGDGIVTTPVGGGYDYGYSVVTQPDGKIIVAGFAAFSGTSYDFALTRYNVDGTLDTSFGSGGIVTTPVGIINDFAHSVVIQPDGKIVVAGDGYSGSSEDLILIRYTSNGALDTSFGGGTGKVMTPVNGNDEGYDVVLQADGKIVVVGQANGDFAIVRYQGDSPVPPVITGIADDSATAGDGITNDSTLTISGTAIANSTVEVFRNGVSIGTTTADATGNWSIANTLPADGGYVLTAKTTIASGTSPASTAYNVTLDTVIATPIITTITDDSGTPADGITNDNTLILAGTAEANSTVVVLQNGTSIGTTTANATGNWTFDYTAVPLADGPYAFTATSTDAAGNSATSAAFDVVIDKAAPAAPAIVSISDDSNVAGDRITNDKTLLISGTAEANSVVQVFRAGVSIGSVMADGAGNWTLDATGTALTDGVYAFTATATDKAGNTSSVSGAFNVTVDTTPPIAPAVTNFSSDSGTAGDRITNDGTLTISGTAEANSTVQVLLDGASIGTTTANASGAWLFDYTGTNLSDGTYAFTATATDAAGNVGAASTPLNITVDKTAPIVPTVSGITTDTGSSATDGVTNDNTLIINGTAEANSVVQVFRNATAIGTATTDGTGKWSFDATALPLANGTYAFTATATDAAGNTSPASAAFNVTIDRTAPTAPAILNITTDSGTAGDRITNDNALVLAGTAEANSTVELFKNGVSIGKTTTDGSGNWTFDHTGTTLADGNYTFTATATDLAGNVSTASTAFVVKVDATAPASPFITSFSTDTGNPDRLTKDNTLILSGTAEANSAVEIFSNGASIGTTTANGSGNWTFDYTGTTLADGIYNFTATAKDVAGNVSTPSAQFTVTVDTTPPAAPTITTINTNTGNPADNITKDNTLIISGTAEAFSSVELFQNGFSIGVTSTDASGNWSFNHTGTPLADATYNFTAKATDATSNVSPLSAPFAVTIDTTAPTAPTITAITDDSGTPADRITNDKTLIISGTAEANSTVEVLLNGAAIGTATTDGTGNWSFDYTGTPLGDGVKAFTAKATDVAGNTSPASAVFNVTIDTAAPTAPTITSFNDNTGNTSDSITNDTTLILTGTAEAGSTVTIFQNGTQIGTVTANATGNWLFDHTATSLTDATYAYTATATDKAGNTSVASAAFNITVDTTPPAAPSVTAITDDTGTPADGITKDNTLIISGTAEANSTVQVLLDGTAIGTATTDAAGNWSFDYTGTVIASGTHSITATATDVAGNSSVPSAAFALTVDTTAPAAPVIEVINADTGIPTDSITSDNQIVITGIAEANSAVRIFLDGAFIGIVPTDGAGNWSFDNSGNPLADGTYQITATATDSAGNVSPVSAVFNVTVDTSTPLAPIITGVDADNGIAGDGITKDNTLIINGTAEANSSIQVLRDGAVIGTTTANATGNWSFDSTATVLSDGNYTFTAIATDVAGNVSPDSTGFNVTIDTTAPAAPTITSITDDSNVANDGYTNDNTLVIGGTADANTTVEIRQNGVVVGTTSSDGSGNWLFDYTGTTLADGTYAFTAVAIDAAGNSSTVSTAFNVTVDIAAPAAPVVAAVSNDSGIPGDGVTNDNTLTVSGTAEANATIQVYRDSTSLGTATADATGKWTFDYTAITLGNGTYSFTATAMDAAGNISASSAGYSVTIDATPPAAPVFTGISDDSGTPADGITKDNTLIINGTAEANSTIQLSLDGAAIGTATTDASGNWSFNYTATAIPDGSHTFSATATDFIGNVSTASTFDVMIDTVPPASPTVTTISNDTGVAGDRITNDATLIIGGTTTAGSTVELQRNGTAIGTAIADGSGKWLFDYTGTALASGSYQFTATLADDVGNVATSTPFAVTIDTIAPIVTLSSQAPAETNAPFTVTAEFSEKVTGFDVADLVIGNGTVSNFTAVSDKAYTFLVTPTTTGTVTVDVKASAAQDIAANNSKAASQLVRSYDVAAPTTPVAPSLDLGIDTGVSNTDGLTKDNTPTLVGMAEAGSTVTLYAGTTVLGTTTTDASGKWSFTPTTPLADGSYNIGVTATDRLGNVSPLSSLLSLQIDTKAAVGVIIEINPNVRDSTIDSDLDTVTLRFSEPIANFDLADLELTYDGKSIVLAGATLTTSDNMTWTLGNLKNIANLDGKFKLTLTKGNIIDQAGNNLEDAANRGWLVGKTGIALPEIEFTGGKPGVNLKGSNGNNTLRGTWLNDTLQGLNGNDILISGSGDFSFGRDRLVGGTGNDRLISGRGKDKLEGGAGDDYLNSGKSTDLLLGGAGNDRLLGQRHDDFLVGGSGNDTLTGGSGSDTFVFKSATDGSDIITDFEVAKDMIDLQAIFAKPEFGGTTPFARFHQFIQLVQQGSDTAVKIDADGSGSNSELTTLVTLQNIAVDTVKGTNFVIV